MSGDDQQIPSVWARPRRPKEQPALSRERIVAEALALLDSDGVEALSMRSLGTRLGAGATSLYRHVANKDELIELVADEVYGEIEVPDPPAGPENWQLAAAAAAHSFRQVGLAHPWLMSVLGQVGLSYLGPNVLRVTDRMLAVYLAAGFELEEAVRAMSTVSAFVLGTTSTEVSWLAALERASLQESSWPEALKATMEQAARDYPRLMAAYEVSGGEDVRETRETNFAYGLDRVLEGIQYRLVRQLAGGFREQEAAPLPVTTP